MTNKNKWLIAIGSVLAATAAFLIIRKARTNGEERPPKGAPQLDIENPGSQHDFPKPPSEAELG